jgi:hypothetical protein
MAELCARNNKTSREIEVTPDFSRWPHRKLLRVETGEWDREEEPVVLPMELVGVDPASVRVAECDEQGHPKALVPAQFDAEEPGRGELCFLLRGETLARTTRRFLVLWAEAATPRGAEGSGGKRKEAERSSGNQESHSLPSPSVPFRPFFPPPATLWNEVDKAVEGETYRVEFDHGTPVNLAAKQNGVPGKPFISMLILSSQETGWADEPGTVEQFRVLHPGPVRTIIGVRKALKAGVVYEKTYTFYPRRFDVTISVNKPAGGLYSRAYYLQPGEYVNDQGFRAQVDGQGDGEGVYGQRKNPRWYAVYAEGWAHSCVALSSFDHVAYWDAGYWGGIGLVTGETKDLRMSYVIHPGAPDAAFAEDDYRRLTAPVRVVVE